MIGWQRIGWAVLSAGLLVHASWAQQTPVAVQLPTVSSFGVHTSVVVPDRGSVYLGGINRAASGRNEFGVPLLKFAPFRNRAIGVERSSSNMWVSVYVHDFAAMDEYLLSQPTRRYPQGLVVRPPAAASRLAASSRAPRPAGPAALSVAELRAKHLQEEQQRAAEALDFFNRGKKAEAAGKRNVARIYYQMAQRRASEPLKSQIAVRLELLDRPQVASR